MTKGGRHPREQRRRTELEERRAHRRDRRRQPQRSLLLPLSLAALVLGGVAIVAFVLVNNPAQGLELEEPAVQLPYEQADGQALGAEDAPVTIEIYSDFQCPACAALAETIEPTLIREYVQPGDVRLVYRDFAFLGPESVDAAVAARCAARQDRFWQYHDYLFANQGGENRGTFSQARLAAIGEAVGLDTAQFAACVADDEVRDEVIEARTQAAAATITSTPTLVVNGERIVGVPEYTQLRQVVERMLAEAVTAP